MSTTTSSVSHRPARPVGDDKRLVAYGSLAVIFACLVAMILLTLPGCSISSAHAVDTPRAREALKTALDHWKKGDSPRSLSASTSPMTVQDFEWESGVRLLEYEVLDEGQPADANLRVRVKLTTEGGKGRAKTTEKSVNYLVGTSPSVTVFRDMLRR
jgi:hypothetical protein